MPVKVSCSSFSVFYSHPGSGDSSRSRPREARTGNASGAESLMVIIGLDIGVRVAGYGPGQENS